MKIKSVILSIICVAMLAVTVGCGCHHSKTVVAEDGKTTFRAIVVDKKDDSITIKPYKDYDEINASQTVVVMTNDESASISKKLDPGKTVEIVYDGVIEGKDPGKISTVYSINLVDHLGNILENDD